MNQAVVASTASRSRGVVATARSLLPDRLDRLLPAPPGQWLGDASCSSPGRIRCGIWRRFEVTARRRARATDRGQRDRPGVHRRLRAAVHRVLGISPERLAGRADPGLVRRLGCCWARTRGHARARLASARHRSSSIAAQFSLVAVVFAAGTWHWSDVPWSHFFAMVARGALYAVRFAPERSGALHAALVGLLLALLVSDAQLRVRRGRPRVAASRRWSSSRLRHQADGATVGRQSRRGSCDVRRDLGHRQPCDGQERALPPVRESPRRAAGDGRWAGRMVARHSSADVQSLVRAGQARSALRRAVLLLDVLGLGLRRGCSVRPRTVRRCARGASCLWRLPLAIQLPSLVLLPLCVVALAGGARDGRRGIARAAALEQARARGSLEMTIAAMRPRSRLRREHDDRVEPSSLRVRTRLPSSCSAHRRRRCCSHHVRSLATAVVTDVARCRRSPIVVLLSVAGAVVMVAGAAYARANGIPRIEGSRLGEVEYTASCRREVCDVSVAARTTRGRSDLDSGALDAHLRLRERPAGFHALLARRRPASALQRPCPNARLVQAWPTVMRPPAGELRARSGGSTCQNA